MSKRLGFRPQYIRANREYTINKGISNRPTRGIKEGFDMKRKTSVNKVYVLADKTGKYAIGYDPSDNSNSVPLLIKNVDLHDKTQWITVDADTGVFYFYYASQPHLVVDITPNDQGLRICRRSDIFKNGYFKFGDTENTIIFVEPSNTSTDGSNDYCLAFQKANAPPPPNGSKTASEQLVDWNKRYSFYNDDKNTAPVNTTSESFSFFSLFRWGKRVEKYDTPADGSSGSGTGTDPSNGGSSGSGGSGGSSGSGTGTGTDPSTGGSSGGSSSGSGGSTNGSKCYLEIVKRNSIDDSKYSFEWDLYEIWDQRTSTNVALETEEIKDLNDIDASAVQNADLLVKAMQTKYDLLDNEYKNNLKLVNGHFIGGMWL